MPPTPLLPAQDVPAEQRVARFRQNSSRLALRLAGLIAVTPVISLQVIRLIRGALLPKARQIHEAEVLLSGLLRTVPCPPGFEKLNDVYYEFHPGVAELILASVPVTDWLTVLDQVSRFVEQHLDHPLGAFRAALADPTLQGQGIELSSSPFVRLAAAKLRRLGGHYAAWATRTLTPPAPKPGPGSGTAESGDRERRRKPLSTAEKLQRVRRPRVRIEYDIETDGAMARCELPFIIGVLGDFGRKDDAEGPQRFIEIDRDNFDDVIKHLAPRLELDLELSSMPQAEPAVSLRFESMRDFGPAGIAAQVPSLHRALQLRQKLADALAHSDVRGVDLEVLGSFASELPIVAPSQSDALAAADELRRIIDMARQKTIRRSEPHIVEPAERALRQGMRGIDNRLSEKISRILHHPRFRRLEGTWRGLRRLVFNTETNENLKIRI